MNNGARVSSGFSSSSFVRFATITKVCLSAPGSLSICRAVTTASVPFISLIRTYLSAARHLSGNQWNEEATRRHWVLYVCTTRHVCSRSPGPSPRNPMKVVARLEPRHAYKILALGSVHPTRELRMYSTYIRVTKRPAVVASVRSTCRVPLRRGPVSRAGNPSK
jgi:hypothetical protein